MRRAGRAPRAGRVYGGLPDAQRRAERRARFIEAGVKAFGRDGFAGTTTRSLCAEAGLTQRYFYESFDGVEALFEAVARVLGEQLEASLLVAAAVPNEPEARLRQVLTVYFEALRKDVDAARILLVEVYTAGHRTGALALRFVARLADLLQAQIDEASPHLAERGIHTGLMATGFIGATHHIALKWMMDRYRVPLSIVVETALGIYLGPEHAARPAPSNPRDRKRH